MDPFAFLVICVAGWMNRNQQDVIEYLQEEIRVLKELLGDLFMSLIHTCRLNDANPFDYLTTLQRHARAVKTNPGQWLPWNYLQTLASLAKG